MKKEKQKIGKMWNTITKSITGAEKVQEFLKNLSKSAFIREFVCLDLFSVLECFVSFYLIFYL